MSVSGPVSSHLKHLLNLQMFMKGTWIQVMDGKSPFSNRRYIFKWLVLKFSIFMLVFRAESVKRCFRCFSVSGFRMSNLNFLLLVLLGYTKGIEPIFKRFCLNCFFPFGDFNSFFVWLMFFYPENWGKSSNLTSIKILFSTGCFNQHFDFAYTIAQILYVFFLEV